MFNLREVLRFGVVGVIATAIHYGIYWLLLSHTGHNMAYTIGFAVSFVCNYFMSSLFTFRVKTSAKRFVGFGMSHLTNYVIQMVLLNIFILLGLSESIAPLPVYVIAIPINFLLVRYALTKSIKPYTLFLIILGFAMLGLNLLDAPTLSDDMIYRFMWNADETAPVQAIETIGDLFRSQWNHYLSTNGRFPAHLMAQFFLVFMPPVVIQVINTLLFVLLIHLCVRWVNSSNSLLVAVLSCFLLFVVFQGFRTAILWSLGAFNYLWPLVAVLSFLLLLRRYNNLSVSLLLTPLAFLAGWSHEALSIPVSVALVIYLIGVFTSALHPVHSSGVFAAAPPAKSIILPIFFFLIGTALCILSPGIWNRAAEGISLQSRLLSGVMNCLFNVRVLWILALSLLILWIRKRKTAVPISINSRASLYEYVALSVALLIVLFCGTNLERVAFFVDFISMLILIRLLIHHLTLNPRRLIILCSIIMAILYIPAYIVRSENYDNWLFAEQQMKQPECELIAVRYGDSGISPSAMSISSWLSEFFRDRYVNPSFTFGFYCSYMAFDANDINMRCAAKLYGKQRLAFLPEDVINRIKTDSTAYTNYELDASGNLYIWHLPADQPAASFPATVPGGFAADQQYPVAADPSLRFILSPEDLSQLLPHQRLVAYKGDDYELDPFNYEELQICGRRYLVFTRPTTNIYRRIKDIEYK